PLSNRFGSLLSHWEGHLDQGALFVDIGFNSTQNGRYENRDLVNHHYSGVQGKGEIVVQKSLPHHRHELSLLGSVQESVDLSKPGVSHQVDLPVVLPKV